ncbi:MAG: hypothetical protein NVS1B7_5520 [Candidatus Saccharimonadales bacterium]
MLGVEASASPQHIRNAYIVLAKKQHPDIGGSVVTMRQLNQAYSVLRNAKLRNEYDVKYRKNILGESPQDLSFTENEDWDLDDVDDFLKEMHQHDKHFNWRSPATISLTVASLCLVLFTIIAVTRMVESSDKYRSSQTLNQIGKR